MSKTYEYIAELQLNDGSVVSIDLEEHGWAEPERLSLTRVFTLVPKPVASPWITNKAPYVRVNIPEGAKPIFKSRMNMRLVGASTNEPNFRAYAVGFHKDGVSYWTWIFPNGSIEQTTDDENPSFNDILVAASNKSAESSRNV